MKTPTSERCNTHTMYYSIKFIFPKIIKKYIIGAFRIMVTQKTTTLNRVFSTGERGGESPPLAENLLIPSPPAWKNILPPVDPSPPHQIFIPPHQGLIPHPSQLNSNCF